MGFFSKIFGKNNENSEPQQNVNAEAEEQLKEEAKAEAAEDVAAVEKEEAAVESVADAEEKEAKSESAPSGDSQQVDLSKWRIAPKNEEGEIQQNPSDSQQFQVMLNCEMGDEESLTNERREELIHQTFKGPEGAKLFGQNTVLENIFIVSYMQNVMVPKAMEAKKDDDLAIFRSLIDLYSKMLVGKAYKLAKWIAIGSLTTKYPFDMGKMALVVVQEKNADALMKDMEENQKFMVGKREVVPDHYAGFVDFLRKSGYAGIALSDGKNPAVALPLDYFFLDGNTPKVSSMENPFLLATMIPFMQEIRRGLTPDMLPEGDREGYQKMLAQMQGQMLYQIANATFVLPTRKDEQGREINPIFQNQDKTEKMLAVYTDVQEMNTAFPMSDGWMSMPTPFSKLVEMVNSMGGDGFVINNVSLGVPVPKNMMNNIAETKAREDAAKKDASAQA